MILNRNSPECNQKYRQVYSSTKCTRFDLKKDRLNAKCKRFQSSLTLIDGRITTVFIK